MNLVNILAVGAGSCLGGVARYILSRLIQTHSAGVFPWATFAVNMLGCLAIGLIYGFLDRGFRMADAMKLFLTVGFCGGFTTFSTFVNENYILFGGGNPAIAFIYAVLSIVAGLAVVAAGYWLTRLV